MKQTRPLLFLSLLALALTSCQAPTKSSPTSGTADTTLAAAPPLAEQSITERSTDEKENINHLFVANGGCVLYMKNGERRSQARFDTDGNFVAELLEVAEKDGVYKDFDHYLIDNGDTLNFFDGVGNVEPDWKILKGHAIKYCRQLVSFTSPKQQDKGHTKLITSTSLIIFSPTLKKFENENSKEAEDWYTAMDDWNYYSHELAESFKKIGVKPRYTEKRFLRFNIENKQTITIDTKAKMNNFTANCLLYKQDKTPMLLYLVDNDMAEVKRYLSER
jgi:hypothetical protein